MAVMLILASFYLLNIFKLVFLLDDYASSATIEGKQFAAIIIPGQGVRNDSLLPDEEHRDIQARLQFAADLLDTQQIKPIIILSGYGRGYRDRDEQNQEATVMYRFIAPEIEKQGVDPHSYLLIENQSHQTIENALFSKRLLPTGSKIVMVLAPAKSFQRVNLVFSTIFDDADFNDFNISVYSLTNQTTEERNREWVRTAGTILVLALPGEKSKALVSKWLFLLFADKSCRKEGYIFNEIICDPHQHFSK